MMSQRVTSPVKEEGADVDGADRDEAEWVGRADRDEAEWVGGAADLDYLDLNCASLCLMITASMAHM